jgi:oxygen-dependent protoporphyrinogen oxidase
VGHLDLVERARTALRRDAPGLEVCGASYDGVGIAACVAGAGAAADRLLQQQIAGARMRT